MKTSVKSLDKSLTQLTISIPFVEFEPHVEQAYAQLSAEQTEFGQSLSPVSPSQIDETVGRAVVLERALNNALGGWYNSALSETGIEPLSPPTIRLEEFEDGKDIEFSANFYVSPPLDLPGVSGIKVVLAVEDVTDEAVEAQIAQLQAQFSEEVPVDGKIAAGDKVGLQARVVNSEGVELSELSTDELTVVAGQSGFQEFEDRFASLQVGEAFSYDFVLESSEPVTVTATVQSAVRTYTPAIDDEFAQRVANLSTLGELRAELRVRLAQNNYVAAVGTARMQALKTLLDQVHVDVPDALVEEQVSKVAGVLSANGGTLDESNESDKQSREELFGDIRAMMHDTIAASFILDQFAKDRGLAVSDDDFDRFLEKKAAETGKTAAAYLDEVTRQSDLPQVIRQAIRDKAHTELLASVQVVDSDGTPVSPATLRAMLS